MQFCRNLCLRWPATASFYFSMLPGMFGRSSGAKGRRRRSPAPRRDRQRNEGHGPTSRATPRNVAAGPERPYRSLRWPVLRRSNNGYKVSPETSSARGILRGGPYRRICGGGARANIPRWETRSPEAQARNERVGAITRSLVVTSQQAREEWVRTPQGDHIQQEARGSATGNPSTRIVEYLHFAGNYESFSQLIFCDPSLTRTEYHLPSSPVMTDNGHYGSFSTPVQRA